MLFQTKIPSGVEVLASANSVKIKGLKGELERGFNPKAVGLRKEDNTLTVEPKNDLKKSLAYAGSINAHIKNMIIGVTKGFVYKMKIVFAHFPINVSVQKDIFLIKNFGGEKVPRKAAILNGVKVDINGQEIVLSGIELEKVSQTAANIEQKTRTRKKDVRIFNDGIYITQKG